MDQLAKGTVYRTEGFQGPLEYFLGLCARISRWIAVS